MTSLRLVLTIILGTACIASEGLSADRAAVEKPIPIIFDTDIGEDIDDTWALCFLLNSPEVDVKLITVGFGNAKPKARIVAKILAAMGREDIPIAIGTSTGSWPPNYIGWVKDFDLESYPGKISDDAVGAIVNAIMEDTSGRLQLHAVGPFHNVALALRREPRIAPKVELVAMGGRLKGPHGEPPKPDSNVRCGIPQAQAVLAADWKAFRLAPLDVTRDLRLTGERYQKVFQSKAPAARTTIDAYKVFEPNVKWADFDVTIESSQLHDTVSSYMAWSTELLEMKRISLRITDTGVTVIDEENGFPVDVAVAWKNIDRFKDLIVDRMTTQ